MSKPKLLFGVGTPFSGTTSLLYTLSWTNDYCHNWKAQQHGYLQYMDHEWEKLPKSTAEKAAAEEELKKLRVWWPGTQHSIFDKDWNLESYRKFRKRVKAKSDRYAWHVDNPTGSKPPELVSENSKVGGGGKMIPSVEKALISEPYTIQKYIDYHKAHWENIKDNYKSLVDFSNSNGALNPSFLKKYIPILQNDFDIKVVMIFRDPVRREWSNRNHSKYTLEPFFKQDSNKYKNRRGVWMTDWDRDLSDAKVEYFDRKISNIESDNPSVNWNYVGEKILSRNTDEESNYRWTPRNMIKYQSTTNVYDNLDYAGLYTKWKDAVGEDNVHATVMEKLFGGDAATKTALSTFLDFEIGDLANCAYVPDQGVNAPEHPYLQDQWSSDVKPLTAELAAGGRVAMKSYYDDYKAVFGSIPTEWIQE